MSIIKTLKEEGIFKSEQDFISNPELEVVMGSSAYGAANESSSDIDIHGFCIPDMEIVFPNTRVGGYVDGFTKRPTNFESAQQHHMDFKGAQYDVCVYSIVKLFALAAENNPNVLDVLWTPEHCVVYQSPIAKLVRDNRKLFLSKASYHRFRGYAHAQQKRLHNSNRKELIDLYGYDVKNAYHIIRLGLQGKQILETGDMVLDLHADLYKDIRKGKYTLQEIEHMFKDIEADMETLYKSSDIQYAVDMDELQEILLACLEMKYGHLP